MSKAAASASPARDCKDPAGFTLIIAPVDRNTLVSLWVQI